VLRSLLALSLAALGCSSPEPAETRLSLVSEQGLLDADVRFVRPVERGENELFVQLTPHDGEGDPQLLAVDATMAAHAHVARPPHIAQASNGFHVQGLELFMTGRWQIELSLALSDHHDTLSFPVDVP
jgi:hypothetical protein